MSRAVTIVYNDHLKHACMFVHGFCGDNCVYPCISKINKLYKKKPNSWFISSGFLSIDHKCVARVMVYIPVIHFQLMCILHKICTNFTQDTWFHFMCIEKDAINLEIRYITSISLIRCTEITVFEIQKFNCKW